MHPHEQPTEHKSYDRPDEIRSFPHGKAEIVRVAGAEVGRLTFEPGWRWSNDVKPIAGTPSCEAPHFQYHVSGRLAIRMDDGTEIIAGPGDITCLPRGHDAWVVGDEPAVVVDWFGATDYAKPRADRRDTGALQGSPARCYIDCREYPSEIGCSMTLSADTEEELLEAAVQHAVKVHGHQDTVEFRLQLRSILKTGTPHA